MLGDGYPKKSELAFKALGTYAKNIFAHKSYSDEDQSVIERLLDTSLQSQPVQTILQIVDAKFSYHCPEVLMHKANVLRQLGLRDSHSTQVIPIQRYITSVLTQDNRREWRGPDGMRGARIFIDAYGVGNEIKRTSRRGSIWAFPAQFGTIGFYHETNLSDLNDPRLLERIKDRIHMVGAYHLERAYESLSGLADIVNELDVIAITALGNTRYDFTQEAIARLREEGRWPERQIIQAGEAMLVFDIPTKEWKYTSWYGSYGGQDDTVFVDNETIGREYIADAADWNWVVYGSSAAVWTTAVLADMYRRQGVHPLEIKEALFDAAPIRDDDRGRPMRVLPS
ncbi:MAG: hypothetical protein ACRD4B_02510, partial [Acidobacteriota bacterium]